MSLGTKTAALLAAIVLGVLASAGLIGLHFQERTLRNTILEGVDGQARIAAHGLATFVEDGLRDAQALALTLPARALAEGRLGEVEGHLARMFETFPKFQNGIFVLDALGRFVADHPSHPELRGQSFAFREYFQRTLQEDRAIVSRAYQSKRTGRPVLTFTAPVRDRSGAIVAIVACSVDLLAQQSLGGYRHQRFGATGYLYIIDGSRQLVLHPEDRRLLTAVEAGKNRLLDAAFRGFEGADDTVNSQGVPMLLGVRRVPGTDWVVGVQVTADEAYSPIVDARWRFVLIAGAALVLVIGVGGVAMRDVTGPLKKLERVASQITSELEGGQTAGAREVAEGAVHTLRRIRSGDEIGHLASSFLRLADELRRTLGSLQQSADDWERTFDSVHDAVVILALDGRIERMNRTAEAWFRTSARRARGVPAHEVLLGSATAPEGWPDLATLREGHRLGWSAELARPAGIFELAFTPVTHAGAITGAVLVVSDVTERVQSEQRIRGMAFYDQLTGLPNRFLLHDRIQQAIASAGRSEKKVGVMFIDLDRFKEVNDAHGHDFGDGALREVTRRLSECVRKNDTLSRFGGDEFVAVLQPIEHRDCALAIADRIADAMDAPIAVDGIEVTIGCSIGIATFPHDGEDGEALLRVADRAMYEAKARRSGGRLRPRADEPAG